MASTVNGRPFSDPAALFAAFGVYGLFSWSVALRTHELAIRLTLGAKPASVGALVIGQSTLLGAPCASQKPPASVLPVAVADDLPSKTQLDKLGDRLRAGSKDEADLRALSDYRLSFRPAYESVIGSLKVLSRLEKTGRPAKTNSAIVDKLNQG